MSNTRSRILSAAEEMVRAGGYNGFSFREIATMVGVKSASVHHHFPTKEVLTLEVARLYHENFFLALGDPKLAGDDSAARLNHYCHVFKKAFESSKRACLCGVLTSEAEQLPSSVRKVVIDFVQANVSWLEQILDCISDSETARGRAQLIYSALEGAMGVSSLQQDDFWIDKVSAEICNVAL